MILLHSNNFLSLEKTCHKFMNNQKATVPIIICTSEF